MRQFKALRQSNKGESLVLITIFSTIVIGIVVTLTVISAMLLSNAGKQKSQDQAYELATSLSARLEELILNGDVSGNSSRIDLEKYVTDFGGELVNVSDASATLTNFQGIPDSSVVAKVVKISDPATGDYYELTVTATAGRETYITKTQYTGSTMMGYARR